MFARMIFSTLIIGLVSCVSLSPREEGAEIPAGPASVDALPKPPSTKSPSTRLEQGEELLKRGDYKEAMMEFRAALKLDPNNESAMKNMEIIQKKMKAENERVLQSLIHLKDTGFHLFQRQEYLQAGQIWKEALHLYETQKDLNFQRDLAFDVDEIQSQLNQIIQTLLDKGVFLYRKGELQAAISVWQDVLSINPQEQNAIDYINKARTKIETLEHLSSTSQ